MSDVDATDVAIIGAGPAGLAAATGLAGKGLQVRLFDAMPSPARKFLMAGKSGLNITNAEPYEAFLTRFGAHAAHLRRALDGFAPQDVREFCADLGIETFVGSSGRVFPRHMKASPLLRAWLQRLGAAGVSLHVRHTWIGFGPDGELLFDTPQGEVPVRARTTILALGGASWPRLGSTAEWAAMLAARGVAIEPFAPSNMGFDVAWPETFRDRFAGVPLKPVVLGVGDTVAAGECVVTGYGIEGSAVYAVSGVLRDVLASGRPGPHLLADLAPGIDQVKLAGALARQPSKLSLSNRLRRGAGISGLKAALLRLAFSPEALRSPGALAQAIKACPVGVTAPRPMAEAISSAGGICWDALTEDFEIKALPGVFAAGEMIAWDAPTGGYLLTASMATGKAAARGALSHMRPET